MRLVSLAISLCLISCAPAFASSSAGVRDLSRTTLRSCPAPRTLKEHYTVFSAPHGESVEIACLRKPTEADWIFSAESGCNDDNSQCGPDLAHPPEGMDEKGVQARIVTWSAAAYDIDEDCMRETYTQSDDEHSSQAEPFWSCKLYKTWKKPIRFKTVGATKATPDYNNPQLEYDVHMHAGRGTSKPGVVRDLTHTSVRTCPKEGRLVEHYAARGIAYPSEILEIACLRTPTVADWLFLAGSRCLFKDYVRKPLVVPTDQKSAAASARPGAPRTVTYGTPDYAIGDECALRSFERVDDGRRSGPLFYWACKRYERPGRSASPLRVETTGGPAAIADTAAGAPNLPFAATLGPDFYTTDGASKDQ